MHLCVIPAHWVVEVKYNNKKKLPSSGREKRFFVGVCVGFGVRNEIQLAKLFYGSEVKW